MRHNCHCFEIMNRLLTLFSFYITTIYDIYKLIVARMLYMYLCTTHHSQFYHKRREYGELNFRNVFQKTQYMGQMFY